MLPHIGLLSQNSSQGCGAGVFWRGIVCGVAGIPLVVGDPFRAAETVSCGKSMSLDGTSTGSTSLRFCPDGQLCVGQRGENVEVYRSTGPND